MPGLSQYGAEQSLLALIPAATARYIALFTSIPDFDGGGGVEASGSGYARKSHSAWATATASDVTRRSNTGAITFAALTGALNGITAWGMYDAAVAGNLIARDYIRDSNGDAISRDFIATDQPTFSDGELKIGIQDLV